VEDVSEASAEEALGNGASEEETIATRLSRAKGRKRVVEPDAPATPAEPAAPDEPAEAASSGGLSLRERLARAAAARHRLSGSEHEAQER
jgi:hypothetical protein